MKQKKIVLTIADLSVGFCISNAAMHKQVVQRYAGYLGRKSGNVLELVCTFTRKKPGRFQKASLKQKNRTFFLERRDVVCIWEGKSGKALMAPSIYAFDACIRVLYATLLPLHGGMLLHSAGIARGKSAFLFAGKSGAGKTTVTRLSRGKALNDEITAARVFGSTKVKAYGTPFWGEMGTGPVYNRSFSLASLFFLKKSRVNKKERMDVLSALSRLLQCWCYFGKNPERVKEVLEVALSFLRLVPVYELHFRKGPDFWEEIN